MLQGHGRWSADLSWSGKLRPFTTCSLSGGVCFGFSPCPHFPFVLVLGLIWEMPVIPLFLWTGLGEGSSVHSCVHGVGGWSLLLLVLGKPSDEGGRKLEPRVCLIFLS